jgi:hypothetical protein
MPCRNPRPTDKSAKNSGTNTDFDIKRECFGVGPQGLVGEMLINLCV